MTIVDIYKEALMLACQNGDEELLLDGNYSAMEVAIVNVILRDLKCKTAKTLEEEFDLSPVVYDAAVYGVSYLLAIRGMDMERSNYLKDIYNSKRGSALSEVCKRQDVISKGKA